MTDTPFPIRLARVHDDLSDLPGARLLVDRVWPRGVRKDALHLDDWIRDVAPSSSLRKWFGHDPAKWDGFRRHYRSELAETRGAVARCLEWCRSGPVILLFAAKDRDHNQAVVLHDHLRDILKREDAT